MAASPQTAQGARQASVRAVTGTVGTYEGDFHALFTLAGISAGGNDAGGGYRPLGFDERFLLWINLKLSASYTNLPEAMQAMAAANGAYNFSSLGTFDASVGSPPVNTVAPVVSGLLTAGQTLTTTDGTWTGT